MKVVIAAAGTGGHINPGLAIANKIQKEQTQSEVLFIGTTYGLENDLVPRSGYPLKTIEAHGLSKKISFQNLKNIVGTIKGIGQAKKILQEFKPDIVIGTGGYICGPVMMAARKLKIPTVLHESNAFPGKAVKMLSKKVNTVLVGFKEAKERLPNAKRVIVTGTPTKIKENFNIDKEKIKQELKLDSKLPILLIFGGSQGARTINNSILDLIFSNQIVNYQIIWAPGPKQFDIIKQKLEEKNKDIKNIKNAKIIPYIYNMEEMMNLADLLLCRSGAMTINEIAEVGKPSILIPLPNVSQNHQEYNARVLEKVGAAKIILDKDLNGEILNQTIQQLLEKEETLRQMGKNAKKIAVSDIEDKIYQEILKNLK